MLTFDWRPQPDGTVNDPRVVGSTDFPQALVRCALIRLGFRFEPSSAPLPYRVARAFAFTARGVIPSQDRAKGGLDKDEIMAVLREHQNEVKYCDERELQNQPSLTGSVKAAWTIGPDGRVLGSVVTDHDPQLTALAACVAERVETWAFPEPQGGGVVNVTFPWLFRPATDE